MTGSKCMGCGVARDIPPYAAITPNSVCTVTAATGFMSSASADPK